MSDSSFSPRTWFAPPLSPWRVIATAVVPFWAYLTLNNLLIAHSGALSLSLSPGASSAFVPPAVRVLQHVALLLVALACYRYAWHIGWRRGQVWRLGALHVLVGLFFASLARPLLNLALYAVDDPSWFDTRGEMETWPFWLWYSGGLPTMLRNMLEWGFNYLFGLGLVLGLRTWLELRDERQRGEDLQRQWLQSRLDALASQLSPHFLFNSVNTIVALARRDTARAEDLVAELADLLRDALRPDRPATNSLDQELRFVQRYLGIESVRFMDRLVVEYDFDPALRDTQLPALLLQPVVENAIKHGVSAATGTATLRISTAREGDDLVLTVANTHAAARTVEGFGIGLRNLRDRLAAAYPGRHGLEAGPSGDGWWQVRIRIRLEEGA